MAVATAVLTGALVVGNSVRESLRGLALEGLGDVTFALRSPRMIRQSLAKEIEDQLETDVSSVEYQFLSTYPSIILQGSLSSSGAVAMRYTGHVDVIGCDEFFWHLTGDGPEVSPSGPGVALSQTLADDLDVTVGDSVILQVPTSASQPAESLLGDKEAAVASGRFRVATVLPPVGLARFRLTPSQQAPRNVFLPLGLLQNLIGAKQQINTILVESEPPRTTLEKYFGFHTSEPIRQSQLSGWLENAMRPNDFGLQIERVSVEGTLQTPQDPIRNSDPSPQQRSLWSDYVSISSDALVLPPPIAKCLTSEFASSGIQPVITYLANTITVRGRSIPYSLVTGIDSTAMLGPLYDDEGGPLLLADDEVVLNEWAAEQLQAKVGDSITLQFFNPESSHGRLREHTPITLTLHSIVPLALPDGQPTKAADPYLTPQLAGVTDQKTMSNWDVPFPLSETIRPSDEEYWKKRSTTPKAFVSLELAKRLWSSRYGSITSFRLPLDAHDSLGAVREQVRSALDPAQLGFAFRPVREQALAAASGTTPFDMLFLGFSMFLIAAAVMLIALLFRLGVQLRADQVGLLTAVGVPARRVRRMLVAETAIVAAAGATVGVALGVGYSALMLLGLRTVWLKAISTPFITLHVSTSSMALGWLIGLIAAIVPCSLAIRSVVRASPARLLSGPIAGGEALAEGARKRWPLFVAILLVVAAVGLGVLGAGKTGEAQAGAFFGAGAAVLAAALLLLRFRWRSCDPKTIACPRKQRQAVGLEPSEVSGVRDGAEWDDKSSGSELANLSISGLARRSAVRNPDRSLLCIGLVAAASFLIVAISAFRLGTNTEGAGGFSLLAETDAPIQFNLSTSDGRIDLGFSDEDDERLRNVDVYSFRVRDGDDASCLNLYQTQRPRIIGVPDDFIDRGGFTWADAMRPGNAERPNSDLPGRLAGGRSATAWALLNQSLGDDGNGNPVVPVVLDADTAAYALKVGGVGARLTIDDPVAGTITFEIVGLLKKSLLQGVLLVSEKNFLKLYPESNGYRFFLVDCPKEEQTGEGDEEIAAILEETLNLFGFDATSTKARLTQLYAVQNTYLSTFQTLGGLGLLLGTLGLAAVQLRSVIERRRELALMRAVGFRRRRLAWMVLGENTAILLSGVGIGTAAAAFALLPHWFAGGATVPWAGLGGMLVAIVAIGIVAGAAAVRAALKTPLTATLRGD